MQTNAQLDAAGDSETRRLREIIYNNTDKINRNCEEIDKDELSVQFYEKEIEALDLFLGLGGTHKLLNGRKPYYSMYEDINEMLEPILPIIKKGFDSIENKIKAKYKVENKESNVLE